MRAFACLAFLSAVLSGGARAEEADPRATVCGLIEASAAQAGIPVEFFTRLIWKESRFRVDAVSPKGAEGIAQFMPGTAALRRLDDSFDATKALPASAAYLAELTRRFGNLGVAAAAYNAGERRVTEWIARTGGLPFETEDYVLAITGQAAEEWLKAIPNVVAGAAPLPRREEARCLTVAAALARPGAGRETVASVPSAPRAPWGVQVAGGFSLNRAMANYRALQKKHRAIIGEGPPMVLRQQMRSRGRAPLFQLRLPADSRAAAEETCRRLQKAGAACIVLKT